jgi:aspartyl-tRNA(Asn)/glutamyl-tRNA(Gln) amidotransferase subunit A
VSSSLPPSPAPGRLHQAFAAIRARNGELNALLTVCDPPNGADGIPLAVKDLFDTAGVRTTCGSALHRDRMPDRTAVAVTRLESAGYVMVGKANLDEFAYGVTGENAHFGATRNPLAPDRWSGGSSGGCAAALAAGMCDVALGTDTSGSIRIPAALCGVVGFKPTRGAVPLDGVFPLAPSLDHAGPMARSVGECAAAFTALTGGPASIDPLPEGLRVGLAESYLEGCRPGVVAAVRRAAALVGAQPCAFPGPERFDPTPILFAEAATVHRDTFPAQAERYGPGPAARLAAGRRVAAVDYLAALDALRAFGRRCLDALTGFDVLLAPTVGEVAPLRAEAAVDSRDASAVREELLRRTRPFNALGWPALALPCGAAEHGLPASVSVVGRSGDDALVLTAAAALERTLASVDS